MVFVGSAGVRYFWNRYEMFVTTLPAAGVALNAARDIVQADGKDKCINSNCQ